MAKTLTLDISDDVEQALQSAAARIGISPEQLAVEWITSQFSHPPRGSAAAVLLSHGAWSMSPDEQQRIERMIEEDRALEEDGP